MQRENQQHHERRVSPVAMSEPVAVLGLGVRASNCLRYARISTVGELVARKADDLREIRNLGAGTLREIVDRLADRGLRLVPTVETQNARVPSSTRATPSNANGEILRSDVEVLKLGVRAANCLRKIGVKTVEELVMHRQDDLLRTRNLGTTTLNQIVTALARYSLCLGMDKNTISKRMASMPERKPVGPIENLAGPSILSSGVEILNLGVRASNCLQALGVQTVDELTKRSAADLARTRSLGSRTLQQIVDALNEHGLSLRELPRRDHPVEVFRRTLCAGLETVEGELGYIVNEVISPRKRHVVMLRLGWSGQRIHTLKELAANPGLSHLGNQVTRERIRQIEVQAKRSIRHRLQGICPRRTSEALRIVTKSTPIAAEDVPELLRNRGVSRVGLHYLGLCTAAELTDTEWALVSLTPGMNSVLISTRERARYSDVLRVLSLGRNQTFSIIGETAKLAKRSSAVTTPLMRLIDVHPEYRWLDRDAGAYWHVPGGRPRRGNKVLYQCRKLFSLCRRLHVDEIHRGVRRTRTVSECPAKHILLEMLRQTNWFLVSGNYVQLREGIRFDELSAKDQRLVRATGGMGATVKFLELRDNLVREGVTSAHAAQHIIFSPFLYPVSRGRYRVLFNVADQYSGKMLSTESTRGEPEGARSHRRLTTGTIGGRGSQAGDVVPSVVVQVSRRALITDRVFVDSHLLSGQWEVVDSDGCRAGRCTTSDSAIQGISAALRLVGAKVGDAFRLRFDVDTKRVEIQRVLAEGCSEPVRVTS